MSTIESHDNFCKWYRHIWPLRTVSKNSFFQISPTLSRIKFSIKPSPMCAGTRHRSHRNRLRRNQSRSVVILIDSLNDKIPAPVNQLATAPALYHNAGMSTLTIITLGKLKEVYWQDAEKEYRKRLSAFTKLEIIELKEESFSEKDSPENIKKREAEKILKHLAKDDFVIALDAHGKSYSSEEFSTQLTQWTMHNQNITFVIGGPLGLDDTILARAGQQTCPLGANAKLSFSKMTFTHQMVRIFLLEQIYRGYMIAAKRKYHY